MDSKLNLMLGRRQSGREPKRLPKQEALPSKTQLKSLFMDVQSNLYSRIELPFGDPPEIYYLTGMRDPLKGSCQWSLYRGEGDQSALAWTVTGNDWEQIHGLICAQFPGWDLKSRTMATSTDNTLASIQTNDQPQTPAQALENSSFIRTLEGDLRNLQVPNLLQTISMGKLTGRLQIKSRSDTAQVFFDDGNPVHCMVKGAEGDAAIIQLVGWEEGQFCFFPEPKTEKKTIKKRLEFLIMEGAQFIDQYKSLSGKGLSFDAIVCRVHKSISEAEFEKLLAAGTGIDLPSQKQFYVAVDNRSTLFELLRSQRLSQVEWVPILFNLINCGLIEFRQPDTTSAEQTSVQKGNKIEWGQISLAEKALTMPESGLYTFPAFLYFLDREFCRFERFQRPFSIVVLKIGLMPKNAQGADDSRSRPLPSPAVKDLGKTIGRLKRQIDILAHYQTFDYGLLLPETGAQAVSSFIDRLSEVLKVTSLQDVGPDESIDFAIGYASLPEDGKNLDTVLSLAWSRLYGK